MSDHEIRTLLRDMASEIGDVRPLGRKALRRTRTRRWAVATTAVVSLATLVLGGTGLALHAGPFAGDSVTSPAGREDTPPPPRPMRGTIVAYDTTEQGDEWWLSAYESDGGELCVVLQYDTGDMAEDCGPYDPEGVGLARDPEIGPPGAESSFPSNLFGWVPADTGRLWVTRGGTYFDEGPEDEESAEEEELGQGSEGEAAAATAEAEPDDEPGPAENPDVEIEGEEEIRLFPAPDGFPFPVDFYALVPGPEDATALRIVTDAGDATVLIMSQPEARAPVPRSHEPGARARGR